LRILLFASKYVGKEILKFISSHPADELACLVYLENDFDILEIIESYGLRNKTKLIPADEIVSSSDALYTLNIDLVVIAWWPFIIDSKLLNVARLGAINTHNSFLPYGRGVHANFWAIRRGEEYGVSIHIANQRIDAGPILAQTKVPYSWEDDGYTVYWRGLNALVELFKKIYPSIEWYIERAEPQNLNSGYLKNSSDIAGEVEIKLDQSYKARDLLNLIRAKQFSESDPCFFICDDARYSVRVEIKRDSNA